MSVFKIGDWVCITKKIPSFTEEFENSWTLAMDDFVNDKIQYKIKRIQKNGILLDETDYYWPPTALTLVLRLSPQEQIEAKIIYLWNKSNYHTKMVTTNEF